MAAAGAGLQALTFTVAGERLAVAADEVAEVIRRPPVTRVPLAPASLSGVANLRGSVVPIVSLGALLHKRDEDMNATRVVVIDNGRPVGLMVDEVLSLGPADVVPAGESPARLLDIHALLARDFDSLARPASAAVSMAPISAAPVSAMLRAYLSVEIAAQSFALPLDKVREVMALPGVLAGIPGTDDAMLGVATLRNRLLPMLSLSTLLGFGAGRRDAGSRVVVAKVGGVHVGLVVDAVQGIVRAAEEDIDPVPPVLTRGSEEAKIQAICRPRGGGRLISILSTDHLLKDGLAQQLIADAGREEDKDMGAVAISGQSEQFVIFQLGGEHYGLPIDSVDEVVPLADTLTRLPRAPAFVEGIMNLRGKVVPVIDQRRRFEVPADDRARKPRIIVVRIGESLAGFVVDGVSEVLSVPAEQLRASPDLASERSKVIDRIANLDVEGRMILLVDPQELLDRAEQDMIAAMHGEASATS